MGEGMTGGAQLITAGRNNSESSEEDLKDVHGGTVPGDSNQGRTTNKHVEL